MQVIPLSKNMMADERRTLLIEYLTKHQRATVKELSQQLLVSEATLRTDLNLLEEEGILKRIHGGAVLTEQPVPTGSSFSFSAREKRNINEKAAVGRKAMDFLQEGQCILIDASTTALELAKGLKRTQIKLTVVTSGIYTALELKDNPYLHVILIGGVLRMGSGAVEGHLGADLLDKIRADILFTSPAGFKLDSGLMDFNIYEVELKRRMVESASRVIALLDSTKFNVGSIASYAATSRVHDVITDTGAPPDILRQLEESGIRVCTVSSRG
jgi:DeoR/GlpR family transcriptional regulator of sugar metabolism